MRRPAVVARRELVQAFQQVGECGLRETMFQRRLGVGQLAVQHFVDMAADRAVRVGMGMEVEQVATVQRVDGAKHIQHGDIRGILGQ